VMVCTYADRTGFSYVTAPEVMPDVAALIELTERSLAELEAAVEVVR
jgi:diacylglycerol O-acyltransferase